MLTGSYRKRLEADLPRWVTEGWLTAENAGAIRRSVAREQGGIRLPAVIGLLGGLLIAASVAAFVAAGWEDIPRLIKLGMILAAIAICIAYAFRLERQGSPRGADAAVTCGVLIFGAGLALVGQMYHLPADWPGGAVLVALGGLIAAVLMRSNGALAIALIAICAWSGGRWEEARGGAHLGFFILYLPALWLSLSRDNRLVHHLVVLAAAAWLAMAPGYGLFDQFDYGLLAYGLALAAFYVALGAVALDRGLPSVLTACLPWGLLGLVLVLNTELIRILDRDEARAGHAFRFVFMAYAVALPVVAALAGLARERRFAWPLAAGLAFALLVPVVFWTGIVTAMAGKIIVASLVLLTATALVVAGSVGGIRRLVLAGSVLFGVAILILLWQTIGTLLDQSLFFLVAGAALLAIASGARRLFARLNPPEKEAA
ncbi:MULTISPECIES: DUF2157 domain-containing protein [Bosea]|uniref:DUF2157 domain-containing protein n=1 Tax=Bosea TaxID=85413 RepID=UPI002150694F|nr:MULTISPECIES: DUF2157 domain-containing protein [Bosea]MCR4520998.1 DUF2157 domain-containing protein [Bosea sp. 47.2.35]MDR6830643.1 putative membrane protein [Bosea robiniae]MDR6897524.1 putative membrane protein [Bosea sp. BE109]MDR7140921.1 putative membrane protein [Bosea sp. BE168]MDR7177559.1 putative membrane protein [Bosea sp. BE271]